MEINQFQDEREVISQQIHENMEIAVIPILNSLEKKLKDSDLMRLEHLRDCLDELTSPFVSKLQTQFASLTKTEIDICKLIKGGMQTKEIAELRRVSVRTIEKFRQIIRKKLKLTKKKINLTNYLRNM